MTLDIDLVELSAMRGGGAGTEAPSTGTARAVRSSRTLIQAGQSVELKS